jgi:hypothetical protein
MDVAQSRRDGKIVLQCAKCIEREKLERTFPACCTADEP